MASLAASCGGREKRSEAGKLFALVLKNRRLALGDRHRVTIAAMHNFVGVLERQDRWKEAEQLRVRCLELDTGDLGADHPDILLSQYCLVETWREIDRDEQTLAIMEDCAECRKGVLDFSHWETELTYGKVLNGKLRVLLP